MGRKWVTVELTKLIISYLHSQGVVIKVDKELPDTMLTKTYKGNKRNNISTTYTLGDKLAKDYQREMLRAGYLAVEPIIEE